MRKKKHVTKVKAQRFGISFNFSNEDFRREDAKAYDIDALVDAHPDPEVWQAHLVDDLMKFWEGDHARKMNDGIGLFPTYRANDGSLFDYTDEANFPPEIKAALADADTRGLVDLEHNYVRAHSRQTFAYGIAYNMTGNLDYLKWCKQGAEAMMEAFDNENGMFVKQNAQTGEWGPEMNLRDAQNLAYGITGLGMYYYLTHDEKCLFRIMQAKEHIFNHYFSHGRGYFTWYPKDSTEQTNDNVEIVAQLDQIYAYMIWLTPALPEPFQSDWKKSLGDIARIMITRFYSERYGFFWGRATDSAAKNLGTAHTDFGHSVKTMWLIYQVGLATNEIAFVNFARNKIDAILKHAYIEKTEKLPGSWARRFNQDGTLDRDKEWWGLAELDQACAILALNDPSYLSYLNETYKYWFKYMVDKDGGGEIHHFVKASDNLPDLKYPKIHAWKTSLHSFEHALFGYLTASQIKGHAFDLYFAFKSVEQVRFDRVQPYLFKANIVSEEEQGKIDFMENGNKKIKVEFYGLH